MQTIRLYRLVQIKIYHCVRPLLIAAGLLGYFPQYSTVVVTFAHCNATSMVSKTHRGFEKRLLIEVESFIRKNTVRQYGC